MAVLFIFLVSFPFPFFVKYCDVRLNDPRIVDRMKRITVIRVLMTLLSKILCLGLHIGGEDIGDQDGNAIPMTVAVTHPGSSSVTLQWNKTNHAKWLLSSSNSSSGDSGSRSGSGSSRLYSSSHKR